MCKGCCCRVVEAGEGCNDLRSEKRPCSVTLTPEESAVRAEAPYSAAGRPALPQFWPPGLLYTACYGYITEPARPAIQFHHCAARWAFHVARLLDGNMPPEPH